MSDTIYAILTDTNARSVDAVEINLQHELTAGAPWFDEN